MQPNALAGNSEIKNLRSKTHSSRELSEPLKTLLDSLSLSELQNHKLLGFAYSRAALKNGWLSEGKTKLVENMRRQAVAQSLIANIGEQLAPALKVGLLKGAALWEDLYRPGEREASDIDLYVAAPSAPALFAHLENLGFEKVQETKSRASSFKTLFTSSAYRDMTIEVHTRIWWLEPKDFAWDWMPADQKPFLRLTPTDQLIHLCGHWGAQHTMISLHWLIDILLVLESENYNWALAIERAAVLRLRTSVELARGLSESLENGAPSTVSWNFLREPRRNLLRYFWLKHWIQDSWIDAVRYDSQWLRSKLEAKLGISR